MADINSLLTASHFLANFSIELKKSFENIHGLLKKRLNFLLQHKLNFNKNVIVIQIFKILYSKIF